MKKILRFFKFCREKLGLSLSWRLAMNYLRLWVLCGVLFFVFFQVLYLYLAYDSFAERAELLVIDFERKGVFTKEIVNPYQDEGLYFKVKETSTGEEIYSDFPFQLNSSFPFLKNIYFNLKDKEYRFVFKEHFEFQFNNQVYSATFYYNLTKDYNTMNLLMLNLILVYLLLLLFTIGEGRRLNGKILKPIQEMSETASRLTASNLKSERINVAGTNYELKELAVVFNDMLDRLDKFYEKQKQFVSNASHELRTPISVIQGYSNLLKRWGSRDELVLEESIEAIHQESLEMQELVEKLLFLSRHDKKTLKLEKQWFPMKPVIEELIKETIMVVSERNIEYPLLEEVMVYGDKQALKQAVRVLVDNAVKYTKEGDGIRISCENRNGDCMVAVEDTGIGMTKVDLENLFERFYRSDEVRNRKISGHGLGLSIAKLIIFAHSGRIKIRTQFTKGTSFFITIPNKR